MPDAKLAPNLPEWMVEHANRYIASGGADGHLYHMSQPGRPEITVPSLLLTTTGRKSGEKYVFPLFYGDTGDGSYIIVASKGGAPKHPQWYLNLVAHPEVEVQVGTKRIAARARCSAIASWSWSEGSPPSSLSRTSHDRPLICFAAAATSRAKSWPRGFSGLSDSSGGAKRMSPT